MYKIKHVLKCFPEQGSAAELGHQSLIQSPVKSMVVFQFISMDFRSDPNNPPARNCDEIATTKIILLFTHLYKHHMQSFHYKWLYNMH